MKKFLDIFSAKSNKEAATKEKVAAEFDPNLNKFVTRSGKELIESNNYRDKTVTHIERNLGVTPEMWEKHYLYAIYKMAEIVQEHPASRMHHHSNQGGLLDHTLEVTLRSIRLSIGYILPPNSEPEEIFLHESRWRFGILITALLHDIGKLIADQETVYKVGEKFINWQPWHSSMPLNSEYVFRYRQTQAKHVHGLHEKLGITLLPKLLTPEASKWLTDDKELMGQIMDTLAASATGSGVIGEIIRKADRESTAGNLNQKTGTATSNFDDDAKPLHIKIMEAIQSLASEGKLKKNMPGSAIWVTEKVSFIVAKSVMEQAREFLLSHGHKGIPQSPSRLVQILNEHKHTLFNETEGDLVQAIINDTNRSWKQKLSFMVIPNENLWLSGLPNTFSGEVTVVNAKGDEIKLSGFNDDLVDEGVHSEPPVKSENNPQGVHSEPPVKSENNPQGVHSEPPVKKVVKKPKSINLKGLGKVSRPKNGESLKADVDSLRRKDDFFNWLFNGVKYRRIRINESGASVHIVGEYVAIVSPKIFDMYLEDNKAASVGLGKDRDSKLKKVQMNIRKLKVHRRNSSGHDFFKIHVRGPRNEETFSAMIIERKRIPEFDDFSPNPMLKLIEE